MLITSQSWRDFLVRRVGQQVIKGEEEVGPPEVIFKHGGHRGSVQDLQCNPKDPWCIASVSEDASWVRSFTPR